MQCGTLMSCHIQALQWFMAATPCRNRCIKKLVNQRLSRFLAIADHDAFAANVRQLQGDHLNDFRVILKAIQVVPALLWMRNDGRQT